MFGKGKKLPAYRNEEKPIRLVKCICNNGKIGNKTCIACGGSGKRYSSGK